MTLSDQEEDDLGKTHDLPGADETELLRHCDSQIATYAGSSTTKDRPNTLTPVNLAEGLELAGNRFRYRLERQLNRGGFGSVYLATCLSRDLSVDHTPPAQVVLKFFHVPQTGDQRSLFRREVSALLALEHDRIIRLYDWRYENGSCFLVLEYYPAGSLLDTEHFMGTPIEVDVLQRVITDLLMALNAAHQASILHLDIKPGNVLRDAAGGYVLTDFGISQGTLVSHHVVETGVGSPGYQAPEQRECNRRWIGPRTDLFGVGATAWSLFTGLSLERRPKLLRAPEDGQGYALPPISDFRPCPPDLEAFIMRLISFDPGARPGGAAEALALLRSSTRSRKKIMLAGHRIFQTGHPRLREVLDSLVDPLWASICSSPRPKLNYVLFHDGEILCRHGEAAYHTFVLLNGTVRVERMGFPHIRENREGTFLGENAALTGKPRTATLVAEGPIWALVFNAAELEQFVIAHPAVALRLIKSLAMRCRANSGMA